MKWYKYNIRDFSEIEYEKWFSLMSDEKRARTLKLKPDDRLRTVAGEMLARCAISEWCGVSAEEIVFLKDENGKPYAKNLDVQFNISHSGDIVVCAVSENPIGIDIEKIREINLKILERICSKRELLYFSEEPKLNQFFEIWTAKEAQAKLFGKGLAAISQEISTNVKITHIDHLDYKIAIAEIDK